MSEANDVTPIDPITAAVLRNAFKAVVNEMNSIVTRSANSPIITEALDCSAALFDREGRLVAHGDFDLPVFIGNLEFTCRAVLGRFSDEGFQDGDVVIINDPYLAGTHLNDVRIITPIVLAGGELAGFCAVCGHWPDIGGAIPGSFAPDAEEIFMEGVRIPAIKLYTAGRLNEGVLDLLLANVRVPSERRGDVNAKVAAGRRGGDAFRELVERFGAELIAQAMAEDMDYSRRLLAAEAARLPDGDYEWSDYIDSESSTNPEPRKVGLVIRVRGDRFIFDLSGSDPACASGCNSTYPTTASALFVATKCIFPHVPMNHGCFEVVEIIAPEGTIVNAAYPAAVSGMAATTYEKLQACVFGAFSRVVPERVMACPYNLINISSGGVDTRPGFGQPYVAYTRAEGGYGGRWTKDGSTGLITLYGSSSKNSPLEVLERRYPWLHTEWSIWPESAGAGRYRGGFGSIIRFQLTHGTARLTVLGDRERFPAFGLFGGGSSSPQKVIVNAATDRERNLGMRQTGYLIKAGDEVTLLSSGGGGVGDPLERAPGAVESDVAEGYLSPAAARAQYGVVISEADGQVDTQATAHLRTRLRKSAEHAHA